MNLSLHGLAGTRPCGAPVNVQMANAREQAQRVLVSDDNIVYSTARDVDDQAVEAEQWEGKLRQSKAQGE